MNTQDRLTRYVLPTYGRFPIVPVRGQGVRVWDEQGREYLDACMGIAVCALGHCHPKVVQAIQRQAATLTHISNLYQLPLQAELAEEIVEHHVRVPGKVFFSNSGAESNEGLIKAARRFGHARPQDNGAARYEVVTFTQSFHGRTLGSMFATGQSKIQERFDPAPSGFRYLPYNDVEALKTLVRPETAAVLLEPLQGEGGVNPATPEFLKALQAICREHDVLLMIDEVQAGFGRCGDAMAYRSICPDFQPDAISWAKGMGGGVPIGGFWLSDRVIDDQGTALSSLLGPGSHGSTYGGNPLVCAAALATLQTIREESLAEKSLVLEAFIRETIREWKLDAINEVRGKGLLLGVGLSADQFQVPDGKTIAALVVQRALELGLLVVMAGPETVRLLPPLNVTEDEVITILVLLKQAILDTQKNH